jgi:hypothetical protein
MTKKTNRPKKDDATPDLRQRSTDRHGGLAPSACLGIAQQASVGSDVLAEEIFKVFSLRDRHAWVERFVERDTAVLGVPMSVWSARVGGK